VKTTSKTRGGWETRKRGRSRKSGTCWGVRKKGGFFQRRVALPKGSRETLGKKAELGERLIISEKKKIPHREEAEKRGELKEKTGPGRKGKKDRREVNFFPKKGK